MTEAEHGAERPARPAPRYGEYATPEEVAAIMGRPAGDADGGASATSAARVDPPPVGAPPHDPARPGSWPPPTTGRVAPEPAPVARSGGIRAWDAPVTVGLLVLGLWNTISAMPFLVDLGAALSAAYADQPVLADLEFGEPTRIAGLVLLVVYAVIELAAIGVAVPLLRRGRLAFWVPVSAGALTGLAVLVVSTVIVMTGMPAGGS